MTFQDLLLIPLLAFLEAILSVDNALVLAMMARPLPGHLQRKALTYGLAGAVILRIAVLFAVTRLMQWDWVHYVGGAYLVFLALRHFFRGEKEKRVRQSPPPGFWGTVARIELMDLVFAVDSILAAVAVTRKFWIVVTGGLLGVAMMRFAALGFIKILRRHPRVETIAYALVLCIGLRLMIRFAD